MTKESFKDKIFKANVSIIMFTILIFSLFTILIVCEKKGELLERFNEFSKIIKKIKSECEEEMKKKEG